MDRKGKQKLKRYFIVYVIFAVFFTVGMYLITKYEENAKATQIALLLAEHPELEGEIVAIWEKSGTVDFIRDRDNQKIEKWFRCWKKLMVITQGVDLQMWL